MSTVIDRVQKRFPKFTRSLKRASVAAKIFNAQTKRMRASLTKMGNKMKGIGRSLTTFVTLPLIAAGAAGVKMFGDFQQGLRGVEKTTGLTRDQVSKLGETFDKLSTQMPVTTAEFLELSKAGGQLGVRGVENLEKFAITMAKVGRTTDVAGEQGAKSIARILTVTEGGIGNIDRFSSALVDLGNNAAAGEQEILEVATRVASQIGRFDVASASVLGISAALKSLGQKAEASGSVVGRAFNSIDQAIKGGGEKMEFLSTLTGIASKDIKQAFAKDAAAVFKKFVFGLNKVEKGEGNLKKVLESLGLSGVRIDAILGTLAKRPEVLAKNMDRASKAFKENTALQKEFLIQTDSFNSKMIILTNTFTSLLRMIGKKLAPTVIFLGDVFKSIFNFLRNNPTLLNLVVVFGVLTAVLGPVLFAFGAFLLLLPALLAGFTALGITSLAMILPWLLIPAAIAAVIAVGVVLFTQWENIKAFFNENPFGEFIKAIFFVLTPLGQLISAVRLVIAAFKGLDAVKSVIRDILPTSVGDQIFGKELGSEQGAKKQTQGLAGGLLRSEAVRGNIDVNFNNAPPRTNIRARTEGPLDFNFGLSGGLL